MKAALLIFMLVLSTHAIRAQFSLEWTGPSHSTDLQQEHRWFVQRNSPLSVRYSISDSTSFRIMSGPYSTTPSITVTYTPAELPPGGGAANLYFDVSGDGLNDLAVHRVYFGGQPRTAVRIVNSSSGQDIQVFDDAAYSYEVYPNVPPDLDGDGLSELVIRREPFPQPSPRTSEFLVYQTSGTSTGISQEIAPQLPLNPALDQNFPNPFNPSTVIEYELPRAGEVTLEIFNLQGQLVRSYPLSYQTAGNHRLEWDGTTGSGLLVSSGSYFYRLLFDGNTLTKKMVLVR